MRHRSFVLESIKNPFLLAQDVIWTSIQRLLNVMDVIWTSKQRCVLTGKKKFGLSDLRKPWSSSFSERVYKLN